ncbi:head-tail adaptor protein [Streptomyces endophytica]|uniref:Head-tail adaptor protein n=1 Tax=Streptomyces endophytica TaxID=2991496 RepID=A0ABY6P6F2_9ACTN|nr:head-tail adaptor protein [Streptomyces endophytica]UZJ29366.1 head-tail adaptor protein [Streptomyces endophytica]
MTGLYCDRVAVSRPAWVTDRWGNKEPDWNDAFTVMVKGRVEITGGKEGPGADDKGTETAVVYLPAHVSIDHHCRVLHANNVYEVISVTTHCNALKAHHHSVKLNTILDWFDS